MGKNCFLNKLISKKSPRQFPTKYDLDESSPVAFAGGEIVVLGKLKNRCKAPEPTCNENLVATEGDMCSVTSTVEV